MNIKKLLPLAMIIIIAMLVAFFVSYKITVAVRTSSQPVTEETTAAVEETTVNTEETTASGNIAVELTEIPTPKKVTMPADESWCLVLLNAYYKMDSS